MTTILFSDGAPSLRGWRQNDDYSLSLQPSNEMFGSSNDITPTVHDVTYAARSTTGTITKNDVIVTTNAVNREVVLSSDTPGVCSVEQSGHVDRMNDGVCTVRAQGQTGERTISQIISTSGGQTLYDAVIGLADNSLRKYLQGQQIAALVDVVPGAASQRAHINGNNFAGDSFGGVNNSNFLFGAKAGFDALPQDALSLMLASPVNSIGWQAWVSEHHYLTWEGHGSASIAGQRVSINGEIVVRYSATPYTGTLCKLLPATWRNQMPSLAGFALGTEINAWTRNFNTYDGKYDATAERRWVMPIRVGATNPYPASDDRHAFQKHDPNTSNTTPMINGGDSGSPVFCGVNGALIILGHTAYRGNACSFFYSDYITQINAAMASLNGSGVYTAQTVDLSGFLNYA